MTHGRSQPLIALGGAGIILVALSLPAWCGTDSDLTAPTGATIVGRVIFRGTVPSPRVIPVARNAETCGASQSIQPLIVDSASGGVKDTVVSLVVPDGAVTPITGSPSTISTITNRACAFHPRIGIAKMGDLLEIRNDDPVLHNTHIKADKKTFINVALLAGGRPIQKRMRSPGLMTVACDAHPFMQGVVMVFDHAVVATTDALGLLSITGVPPGKQEISLWHETLGTLKQRVTVPPQGHLTVTFEYP